MKRNKTGRFGSLVIVAALLLTASPFAAQQPVDQEALYRLVNKVRKKIVMLDNFGVFDWITFGLKQDASGGIVVALQGYASRPTLKKSAERVTAPIIPVIGVAQRHGHVVGDRDGPVAPDPLAQLLLQRRHLRVRASDVASRIR